MPQPLRSALPVLGAAALLAGTVLAAPSVAAEPASLSITSVAPVNDSGGLSGWLPIACSVRVELADPTPADPSRYVLELSHPDGSRDRVDGAYSVDGAQAPIFQVPCDLVGEGSTVDLRVVETDDAGQVVETSATRPFELVVTGHPGSISDSSVLRDGRWTNVMGRPATIGFADGEWEPGTRFATRIWTSAGRTFTAEDWSADTDGGAAIVDVEDQDAPVLRWVPRPRDTGRWVWISIVGQAPGHAAWRFTFAPELVVPAPMPTAFFDGYGARVGTPRVGRTVAVTRPSTYLTAKGVAAGVKATYRWMVDGRPVSGTAAARRTFTVPSRLVGKQLSVRTWFAARGYRTIHRDASFGRVRR